MEQSVGDILASFADILFFAVILEFIFIVFFVFFVIYLTQDLKKRGDEIADLKEQLKSARQSSNKDGKGQVNEKSISPMTNNNGSNDSFIENLDNAWVEYGHNEKKKITQNANDFAPSNKKNDLTLSDNMSFAPSVSINYEYLDSANDGQFRKLLNTEEKSFFRTWLENGTRLFEFHGNVEKALANINAIFDDVCEIEGKQNGATQIHNVEPGILDSQLKIEKKAKIKLI